MCFVITPCCKIDMKFLVVVFFLFFFTLYQMLEIFINKLEDN